MRNLGFWGRFFVGSDIFSLLVYNVSLVGSNYFSSSFFEVCDGEK